MTATLKYILGAIISLHLCVFLSPIVHIVKILFLRVLRSMQVWCWAWLSDLPYNFHSVDYLLIASVLLCSLIQLERVWLNKRILCLNSINSVNVVNSVQPVHSAAVPSSLMEAFFRWNIRLKADSEQTITSIQSSQVKKAQVQFMNYYLKVNEDSHKRLVQVWSTSLRWLLLWSSCFCVALCFCRQSEK